MNELWQQLRSLFQKAESSSPSEPALHQVIDRSAEEREDFEHWKKTLVRRRMQDWLVDQYAVFQVLPDDIDESLDFLDTPSSKGFAIYFYKTRYSVRDVRHFFDFLKERVLEQNYRVQISDRRAFNRPEWVETIERHYLKPRTRPSTDGLLRQAFGNITIEHIQRNDRAHLLKFHATFYQDRQYQKAQSFQELVQQLGS